MEAGARVKRDIDLQTRSTVAAVVVAVIAMAVTVLPFWNQELAKPQLELSVTWERFVDSQVATVVLRNSGPTSLTSMRFAAAINDGTLTDAATVRSDERYYREGQASETRVSVQLDRLAEGRSVVITIPTKPEE